MHLPAAPVTPPLIVTVDTEGDDLWSRPRAITTRNAACLPRFHELCRRHALRPVYLATFEMAVCPEFQAFGREVLGAGDGEIGMHLHAWNSPPDHPIGGRDWWEQPFATQFPEAVIRAKTAALTRCLEDAFQAPVRSHRGGRWAFDSRSAHVLADLGYRVDASVTPGIDWRRGPGGAIDPNAPDFTAFPRDPYVVDLDAVDRSGTSPLLEVPMTTYRIPLDRPGTDAGAAAAHVVRWLRPNGRNLTSLRWIVARALEDRRPCLVLMLHSSELMPGGSPGVRRVEDVEALYRDLDALFAETSARVRGATLHEFYLEATGRPARTAAATGP